MSIKSNIGSALVGTLAFSVGGIILTMGSLNLNKHALNEAKNQNVRFSEDNLRQTVQKILEDPIRCYQNLIINQNKDNITKLIHTKENQNDLDNLIIKIESEKTFKDEGDIKIVRMKFAPGDKIFSLYYTKPTLEKKQKRIPDEACTNADVTGCYYISCEVDLSNNCQVHLNGCSFPDDNSKSSPPKDCEDNLLSGTQSCFTLQSKVLKTITLTKEENGNTYLTGLSELKRNPDTNEIQSSVEKLALVCPPGKYPIRKIVEEEGEKKIDVECLVMCTGGSSLNKDVSPPRCECPANTIYKKGSCVPCPQGASRSNNPMQIECTCDNSQFVIRDNVCKCPPGKHQYRGRCITCKNGQEWNGSRCACPTGHHLYKGNCIICPTGSYRAVNKKCICLDPKEWDYEHPSRNQCICQSGYTEHADGSCHLNCPPGKRRYNDQCIECPRPGSYWSLSNNRCVCNYGKRWEYPHTGINECKCPPGEYPDGDFCRACPSGQHRYNDQCIRCPSGSTWDGTICNCHNGKRWEYPHTGRQECKCPADRPHNYLNRCNKCPSTQHLYNGRCIICPNDSSWNGSRCNCHNGRIWNSNNNQCECPSHLPHYYTKDGWLRCRKCPEGQHPYYTHCITCPNDSTWNGSRCVCSAGRTWYFSEHGGGSNQCNCHWSKPHFYSGKCNKCAEGQHYYRKKCHQCPEITPHHYSNACHKCPADKPHNYRHTEDFLRNNRNFPTDRECHRCPQNTPHYYSGGCHQCNSARKVYDTVLRPNRCRDICSSGYDFVYRDSNKWGFCKRAGRCSFPCRIWKAIVD